MQIRLTVVDPQAPVSEARGRSASSDVLVTAPAGTALAAVASALASAVTGEAPGSGAVVLYAGEQRLDATRTTLGEPPLTDGAVLSLAVPAAPEAHPEIDDAPARLHVVAGPDAGGVHLLHGGQIRVGRSTDADVPLDDPDVSRVHCAVTLSPDGRVTVTDLGSTNGTTLDGTRVTDRAVHFPPGALLRIGESALRLAPPGETASRVPTTPDGEGHVRVAHARVEGESGTGHAYGGVDPAWGSSRAGAGRLVPGQGGAPQVESRAGGEAGGGTGSGGRGGDAGPSGAGGRGGAGSRAGAEGHSRDVGRAGAEAHAGSGGRSGAEARAGADGRARFDGTLPAGARPVARRSAGHADPYAPAAGETHGGRSGFGSPTADQPEAPRTRAGDGVHGAQEEPSQGSRKRGGLSAWARRLTGNRNTPGAPEGYDAEDRTAERAPSVVAPSGPEIWPDPAALLLTALGPGPRLWERAPGHSEFLTVRLATADRTTADGAVLPAVPVTAGLREAGALGLAGPRPRLSGLARAVLAQFAALHSPDTLEIVLLTTDRARPAADRAAEWAWLGWLPHVRPAHSQDCRLLLAHDHEQATARVQELLHRLDERDASRAGGRSGEHPRADDPAHGSSPNSASRAGGSPSGGGAAADGTDSTYRSGTPAAPGVSLPAQSRGSHHAHASDDASGATARSRPSWAREDRAPVFPGPYTVVVVDGDPGTPALREALGRLVRRGPEVGVHVLVLSETDPGSLTLPVAGAYEAACAVVPLLRECGAVGLLGGDVATVLRLVRVAPGGGPVGEGTVGAVDAVSTAWAERFARALAPLRPDAAPGEGQARVAVPLPQSARLLDELGLARATPASLMARWADAADDADAVGGRALAVLGAGARGPVAADLVADGPHLLIEGPDGSGRTELLRAIVASLAAAERPDRLSVVLMDGRDSLGRSGEGLRVCTDLPHVTTHLTANDPVVMREFAQSLTAELKRRAELLGRTDFTDWHTHRTLSGHLVNQRASLQAPARQAAAPGTAAQHAAPGHTASGHTVPAQGVPAHTGAVQATASQSTPAPRGAGGSLASQTAAPPRGTATDPALRSPANSAPAPHSPGATDLEAPPSTTLRLRPNAAKSRREADAAPPLPRLIVVVDDLDALISPALGSPGRPSAGSVTRALEAVAREGARLGVHLVAAAGPGGRTAESESARRATLRIVLEAPGTAADGPSAGRGRLGTPDGRTAPFQGGRVTGRIPRTATLRPTVTPLEWHRMGDPPTRRPVRELGNGPTDLALLASALERAAKEVSAAEVPSLLAT
ncbi:FHA domain-containing protein [Streptomyces niveiscabiei]|uniref:FHA domain-containing protein n=1 Tax=Streptomyces niveiscabiei TaxID=164115 RepID=UPI0029A9E482|nr:FHA domain-containing protein [Streptomyces niveiscabiei]MDX3385760.1 FHA domain-containing protein [Streptomyces niveiscabiei]